MCLCAGDSMGHITKGLPAPYRYAHPICVAKKLIQMGYRDPYNAPRDAKIRAAEECLKEGKILGIVKLLHPEEVAQYLHKTS